MNYLKENERTEELQLSGLRIIQSGSLYCFTSDSVILSKFASSKKNEKVADFCSGSGIVGLHYYGLHVENVESVKFFELQSDLFDMSLRTISLNGLESKFSAVQCDVAKLPREYNGYFSLILCNPPYSNSGEKSEKEGRAVCRHETDITLEEVISSASFALKFSGRLAICGRCERLCDTFELLRKYKLEPKRLQFVSGNDKRPYLYLIEASKGGKSGLTVEKEYRN